MSPAARPATPAADEAGKMPQAGAGTLGVWVFLATELMFFGPLLLGYFHGRLMLPQAFAAGSRHTEVWLGTANTAILLTSSLCMALSVQLRKLGQQRGACWLLVATAFLGLAFLGIKGYEYSLEWGEHLFPGRHFAFDPAMAAGAQYFFYLYFALTGLHALHLLLGISLVVLMATALARGHAEFARHERIELLGLYWHFVDAIWIFLYPMLYLVGRAGH